MNKKILSLSRQRIFLCFLSFLLQLNYSQIYVQPNPACTHCNGSITSPFPDIKTALSIVSSGSIQLILMDGIFFVNNITIINRSLSISSMNGASSSLVDGNNTYNCFNLIYGSFAISDITIRNCKKTNENKNSIEMLILIIQEQHFGYNQQVLLSITWLSNIMRLN